MKIFSYLILKFTSSSIQPRNFSVTKFRVINNLFHQVYLMVRRRRRNYYERDGNVPRYQMDIEREQLLEEEEQWEQECEKLIAGGTEFDKVN